VDEPDGQAADGVTRSCYLYRGLKVAFHSQPLADAAKRFHSELIFDL